MAYDGHDTMDRYCGFLAGGIAVTVMTDERSECFIANGHAAGLFAHYSVLFIMTGSPSQIIFSRPFHFSLRALLPRYMFLCGCPTVCSASLHKPEPLLSCQVLLPVTHDFRPPKDPNNSKTYWPSPTPACSLFKSPSYQRHVHLRRPRCGATPGPRASPTLSDPGRKITLAEPPP